MTEAAGGGRGAFRYAVIGNPVAHSLSPWIHAAFAVQTGRTIDYRRVLAPLDGFDAVVGRFVADGGCGFNVTVPFKLAAFSACGTGVTDRARIAGAVNCVSVDASRLAGDNTDGVGLVADLRRLLGVASGPPCGRVLLIGTGGAARGVIGPLLDCGLRTLVLVGRDPAKVATLAGAIERSGRGAGDGATLEATTFDRLDDAPYDVIVNATSTSLSGSTLPLSTAVLARAGLAYDMMYGAAPTAFMSVAASAGAAVADGLGMLVEQAAESYFVWHGVRPDTVPVLSGLRESLRAAKTDADAR